MNNKDLTKTVGVGSKMTQPTIKISGEMLNQAYSSAFLAYNLSIEQAVARRTKSEKAQGLLDFRGKIKEKTDQRTSDAIEAFRQKQLAPDSGYLNFKPFYKKGFFGDPIIAGFVAETKDNIIVSYCGSYNLSDFLRDAMFKCSTIVFGDKKYTAHHGCVVDYEKMRDSQQEALSSVLNESNKDKGVIFTGHSLGGAHSIFGGIDYKTSNRFPNPIAGIFTYGAPLTLDDKSAKQYDETLQNIPVAHILVAGDPVTKIPPSKFGYRRPGYVLPPVEIEGVTGIGAHRRDAYENANIQAASMEFNKTVIKKHESIWGRFNKYLTKLNALDTSKFWDKIANSYTNYLTTVSRENITDAYKKAIHSVGNNNEVELSQLESSKVVAPKGF